MLNVASVTNKDHGDRKLLVTVKSLDRPWGMSLAPGTDTTGCTCIYLVQHLLPRAEHPDACLQNSITFPQDFCRAMAMMYL